MARTNPKPTQTKPLRNHRKPRQKFEQAKRGPRKLRLEGLEQRSLMAADIAVIDANVQPLAGVTQSVLNGMVELNGKIYYRDTDPQFGAELYQYDPTTNSSRRVTDWNPGIGDSISNSSNLSFVAKSSTKLFFSIANDTLGRELGVYDTVNDTFRILDAAPGSASSTPYTVNDFPGIAAVYGNKLYYLSDKLYWFDFDNPTSVPNTVSTLGHTGMRNLTVVGNKLYFTSFSSGSEQVRWIDLTISNPLPQTVTLPTANSYSNFRAVGSRLYFVAFEGAAGTELRWIDTTLTNPTVNTVDFVTGSSSSDPRLLTVVNNRLYFVSNNSAQGTELRWIDPAISNSIQSIDVNHGSSSSNPSSLLADGNRLYFNAFEPLTGSEIRWIDATLPSPTLNTFDSTPGSGSLFYEQLVVSNTHLFATSNVFGTGVEPYYLDLAAPTPVMTRMDTRPGSSSANPSHLLAAGSRLYFAGELTAGRDLTWVDVAANPSLFNAVDVRDTVGAFPDSYYATEDKIFFAGTQAYSGKTIGWFPTKTMNPVVQWLPWNAGETPVFAPMFTQVANKLFFISTDATFGGEVRWIDLNDPTMTLHTLDVNPGPASSTPASLTRVGNRLFWSSYEPITGKELRWVDATQNDPTLQTLDLSTTAFWGNPTDLKANGDQLYFVGFDNTVGAELRRVDTSLSSWTVETFDLNTGSGNGFVSNSTFVGDRFYFVGADSSFTERIRWISTDTGLTTINTVNLGTLSGTSWLVTAGNRIYFRASDSPSGLEMRWFDTTLPTPTLNTLDLSPGLASTEFEFEYPAVKGNKMFYSARNFLGEKELRWVDTTSSSTIVNTLDLGIGGNNPSQFKVLDDRILLSATDSFLGTEMVILNPTPTPPTFTWVDLNAGFTGSFPRHFTQVANRTYFHGFKLGAKEETYIYSNALAPTDISLSSATIPENEPAGALVGLLSTTDLNAIDSFTYSLVPGIGDTHNSQFQLVGNELRTIPSFDFESQSSYSIRLRTTDSDGLTFEETVTIQVTDLVEEIHAVGTAGNDLFELTLAGPAFDQWLVRRNGITLFQGLASMVSTVFVDGLDGTDTIRLSGTNNAETFQANGDEFFFNGHRALATQIETRELLGQGGNDTFEMTGSYQGLVDGGTGTDRLEGPDAANLWSITASNLGTLNSLTSFRNVESLTGGTDSDTFQFAATGKLNGPISGGAGDDLVDQSLLTIGITLNAQTHTATNVGGWSDIETWRGSTSSANDKFTGRNVASTYLVEGPDQTAINGNELRLLQFEHVTGGTSADSVAFLNSGSALRGTFSGGSGVDAVSWAAWTDPISVNLATKQAPGATQWTGFENYQGSAFQDTLIGPNTTTSWQITGSNSGLVGAIAFSQFENLQGNLGADSFKLTSALSQITGNVDGGAGTDTVTGPNLATTWLVSGAEEVDVQSTHFTEIENLTGGTASDLFTFADASAMVSGTLNGGTGFDTISWSTADYAVSVNLLASSATQVSRWMAIERIQGGTQVDQVFGSNANNTWQILGPNSGKVGTLEFQQFEIASGGLGNDSFRFIGPTASMSGGVIGGGGVNTLTGPDVDSSWQITGPNSGSLLTTPFQGFQNLTGGLANDDFQIADTGSLSGNLSGGLGVNSLSFATWTSAVGVDLSLASAGNATAIAGVTSKIQMVIGGSGNDTLKTSSSIAAILLGNAGSDSLTGGSGKDVLLGGTGDDLLTAGSGEDLLIAGTTSWDTSLSDLRNIRAEWTSTRPFATRVANLNGTGTGPRLNGDTFLTNTSITADLEVDQLFGGLSNDWFWCSASEALDRIATDRLDLD